MTNLEKAATFRDRLEKAGLQPVPWQGHMAVMAGSLVDLFLVGQALSGMRCPVICVVQGGTPGYVCYWDQVPYVGSYEERNQE